MTAENKKPRVVVKAFDPRTIRDNDHRVEIVEQIFECFLDAASQDEYHMAQPDPVDARVLFNNVIHQGLCVFAIDTKLDKIVGGLSLVRETYPWNKQDPTPIFTNPWFYVMKDYRKSNTAVSIVKVAKKLVSNVGGKMILTTMWEEGHEEKARFLQMCGLRRIGGVFAVDLSSEQEQKRWDHSLAAEATQLQ